MATIKSLRAKEILDSQGSPTIHVALWLDNGDVVETSVPNGMSHYATEAQTLQDQDPEHMAGKGVQKAVLLINKTLSPQLIGQDPLQQEQIDQLLIKLDATADKSQTGANTLIAISQVVMKAGALVSGRQLYQYIFEKYQLSKQLAIPTCLYGLVNGGEYGSGNLDFKEFLIIPASHSDYRVSLEVENALRVGLQKVLQAKEANYSTGSLGGFTPSLHKNTDVFDLIIETARKTSYILARDFFFGLDAGGEQLINKEKYTIKDKSTALNKTDLQEYYQEIQKKYSLNYFEDPFAVKDVSSWQRFYTDLGKTTRIAGDTITATNPKLVREAIKKQYCNTLVVKPSQIGTLTETLEAVRIAREAGWSIVVSQRTGETNDDFLADFAVGIGAEFSKFGPVNRGESVAKYNRLADIYLALEKKIQEGKTMSQPNQPTNGDTANSPQTTPVSDDSTGDSSLPQPTDAPTTPSAEPTPAEPTTEKPAIQDEVSLGSVTPTADATPTESTESKTPAEASKPTTTVEPTVTETPVPAASQDNPSEAPINTPPAAKPVVAPSVEQTPKQTESPAKPGNQPSAQDTQQAIDSTLEEIGTKPTTPPAAASETPPDDTDSSQ